MTKKTRRRLRHNKRRRDKAERRRAGGYTPPKKPKKRKEFVLPPADPDSGKYTAGVTTHHPYANRHNPYNKPSPALIRLLVNSGTK